MGKDTSVTIPSNYSGPVAILGASGGGKTSCSVLHTLCRTFLHGNFFAIDIKGDLEKQYAEANPGEVVKVLNLRGKTQYTYEPFAFIRSDDQDNKVSNIRELVNAILYVFSNGHDEFWIKSAREYLTSGLLYFFDMGLSFIEAVSKIMITQPAKLINTIGKSGDNQAKSFINNFFGNQDLADSKLLMGMCQEVSNRLSVIVNDPRVRSALSPSDNQIQWTDLEIYNNFLSVPEDRLEQYNPVLALIITQLIRSLERRHEKHSIEGRGQHQVLVMLDEFARLGKIDVIESAVSTLRSKNVVICLVLQSKSAP